MRNAQNLFRYYMDVKVFLTGYFALSRLGLSYAAVLIYSAFDPYVLHRHGVLFDANFVVLSIIDIFVTEIICT